jgi:chemotaxis protein MotB
MAKHQEAEEHGESAPLWIISFADLVTLLMSFFVILSVKPSMEATGFVDPHFAEVAAAIRAAFSNMPQEELSGPAGDYNKLIKQLLAMAKKAGPLNKGDSEDKGIHGRDFRVRRLRDGMEITMGGPVMFEPFAAKPTPEGQEQIKQLSQVIKGHRNIIEVRGHSSDQPMPSDWTYQDSMKLSYARAEYVGSELIQEGCDPRTIRLVAVGPNEPAEKQAYDASQRSDNRRVEVIVRESLIDDYVGQSPTHGLPTNRPVEASPSAAQNQ